LDAIFFSDSVKNFCPTLKFFVRLAMPCLEEFSLAFSVLLAACKCFPTAFYMFYNLFHHTPRMISDSFLAIQHATSGAMRI